MGIRNYICSATDILKRSSPDLTPVKDVCWTSCTYANTVGAKTVAMARNLWPSEASRASAVEKLKGVLPDAEARSLITSAFAKNAALYAAEEILKTFPFGRVACKLAKQSLVEAKKKESRKKLSKADSGICIFEKKEANTSYFDFNQQHQKPEDVIRTFMMKGFFTAKHMFDGLMGAAARLRKDKKS